MGLFVKQNEERSELQQKIAADIAERQRARALAEEKPRDGVEDSTLVEGTSHITKTGIIVLAVLVIAVVVIVVFVSQR